LKWLRFNLTVTNPKRSKNTKKTTNILSLETIVNNRYKIGSSRSVNKFNPF
jgi:hypothetical protein